MTPPDQHDLISEGCAAYGPMQSHSPMRTTIDVINREHSRFSELRLHLDWRRHSTSYKAGALRSYLRFRHLVVLRAPHLLGARVGDSSPWTPLLDCQHGQVEILGVSYPQDAATASWVHKASAGASNIPHTYHNTYHADHPPPPPAGGYIHR